MKEVRCIRRICLPLLTCLLVAPATAEAKKSRCNTASCEARVLAKNHGGCRSQACIQRVRLKRTAREIRRIAPYRCGFGRSAIPCYIVLCESGGSWNAYNPSGAAGRYQIMGMHGRPWPANTQARRLAHHRIAARLWAGGRGARNWVCA